MAGKSGQKSRFSGRRAAGAAEDRDAKRHKSYSIKQFLQPLPKPGAAAEAVAAAAAERDSSEEPEEHEGPSQTPAVGLLAAAAVPQSTGAPTVPGAKLQTALLRSLQHRFATQQALETPAGLGGAPAAGSSNQLTAGAEAAQQQRQGGALEAIAQDEEEDEEEDGFQIFSQLAYEPTFLSQRPPELGGTDPTSQLATSTQLLPSSQQEVPLPAQAAAAGGGDAAAAAADDDEGGEWLSSQFLSQPPIQQSQQQATEGAQRTSGGCPTHKTTPALHSSERVHCNDAGDGPASGQKMFPLFRPRSSLKKLYIVRHGESTYNAAVSRGPSWADPQIFDAQLTTKGQQQACQLRKELAALNLPPDTLWLTSPLQRAMQTLLLACPGASLLKQGSSTGAAGSENSSAVPNGGGGGEQAPNVVVLQSITEKVFTCGDIGHPASELCRRYPQLAAQLAALPEQWWYGGTPDKPNCALRKHFGSHEPKQHVMARICAFRRWLQERPETTVVAVGHSSYWRVFEEVCRGSKPERMRNCEFRLIHF